MNTDIVKPQGNDIMERVLLAGDLSRLSPDERVTYYRLTCESLKLNPLTRPFDYITLNGKLQLYARKDATDQIRKNLGVSIAHLEREVVEGCYTVIAHAALPDGRTDESIGAVPIENLRGVDRANAMMKAETKAKRRVTLSICGLGWLDETELATIADARAVQVNMETGEIVSTPPPAPAQQPAADGKLADAQAEYKAKWARYRELAGTLNEKAKGVPFSDHPDIAEIRNAIGVIQARIDDAEMRINAVQQQQEAEAAP